MRLQAPQRAEAAAQTDAPLRADPATPSSTAACLVAAAREEILRLQALNERLLAAQALGQNPSPNPSSSPRMSPATPAGAAAAVAGSAPGGKAGLVLGIGLGTLADSAPGEGAHALQAALRMSRERARRLEDSLRVGACQASLGLCQRLEHMHNLQSDKQK